MVCFIHLHSSFHEIFFCRIFFEKLKLKAMLKSVSIFHSLSNCRSIDLFNRQNHRTSHSSWTRRCCSSSSINHHNCRNTFLENIPYELSVFQVITTKAAAASESHAQGAAVTVGKTTTQVESSKSSSSSSSVSAGNR